MSGQNTERTTKESKFQIPPELRDALKKGKVIPFAGAGVSRGVRRHDAIDEPLFPSWKELLERTDEWLEKEDAKYVRACLSLKPPKFKDAARHAQMHMGRRRWVDFLKKKCQLDLDVGQLDQASLAVPRSLWHLGNEAVITTNYDRVIEWAYDGPKDAVSWDVQNVAELPDLLSDSLHAPVVWHLHGTLTRAENVILTDEGYQRLYSAHNGQVSVADRLDAALEALENVLLGKTLLFVGFSFADGDFVDVLKRLENTFKGYGRSHYALMHKDEEGAAAERLKDIPIRPLFYQDHQLLPDILKRMGDRANDVKIITSHYPPPLPKDVFVNRERELGILNDAWEDKSRGVVVISAPGGMGKTALAQHWFDQVKDRRADGPKRALWWSFNTVDEDNTEASDQQLIEKMLETFQLDWPSYGDRAGIGRRLVKEMTKYRTLLVLDGLDRLQKRSPVEGSNCAELVYSALAIETILHGFAEGGPQHGLCVITTRTPLPDFRVYCSSPDRRVRREPPPERIRLEPLDDAGAQQLLRTSLRRKCEEDALARAAGKAKGDALSLALLGHYIRQTRCGRLEKQGSWDIDQLKLNPTPPEGQNVRIIMREYLAWLEDASNKDQNRLKSHRRMLGVLRSIGLCRGTAKIRDLRVLWENGGVPNFTDMLDEEDAWRTAIRDLKEAGILTTTRADDETTPQDDDRTWTDGRNGESNSDGDHTSIKAGKVRGHHDDGQATGGQNGKTTSEEDEHEIHVHPLVRDFLGDNRKSDAAWRDGHRRMSAHFEQSVKHWRWNDEAEVRQLYRAVYHACKAGEIDEDIAEDMVRRGKRPRGRGRDYHDAWRILWHRIHHCFDHTPGNELGLWQTDLDYLSHFFRTNPGNPSPYSGPNAFEFAMGQPKPKDPATRILQAHILNEAGFDLRAVGRLDEARTALIKSLKMLKVSGSIDRLLRQADYKTLPRIKDPTKNSKGAADGAGQSSDMRLAYQALKNTVHIIDEADRELHEGELPPETRNLLRDIRADVKSENHSGRKQWELTAVAAGNLAKVCLGLGRLDEALDFAVRAVIAADIHKTTPPSNGWHIYTRAWLAQVLHYLGMWTESSCMFDEAEAMQRERDHDRPLLTSTNGFRYCEFLLDRAEVLIARRRHHPAIGKTNCPGPPCQGPKCPADIVQEGLDLVDDVQRRADKLKRWEIHTRKEELSCGAKQGESEGPKHQLFNAVDNLTRGRIEMLKIAAGESRQVDEAGRFFKQAEEGFEKAGKQTYVPRGYLYHAAFLREHKKKFCDAQQRVNWAWAIAERFGMRLLQADCHLEYARLYEALGQYQDAEWHLKKAKDFILEARHGAGGYRRHAWEVIDCHLKLARHYLPLGQYRDGERHLECTKDIIQRDWDADRSSGCHGCLWDVVECHLEYARRLMNQGQHHYQQAKQDVQVAKRNLADANLYFLNAERHLDEAKDIVFDDDDPSKSSGCHRCRLEVIDCHLEHSRQYLTLEKYPDVERHLDNARDIISQERHRKEEITVGDGGTSAAGSCECRELEVDRLHHQLEVAKQRQTEESDLPTTIGGGTQTATKKSKTKSKRRKRRPKDGAGKGKGGRPKQPR